MVFDPFGKAISHPSTKKTTDLFMGEWVFWYGMFAPTSLSLNIRGLSMELHLLRF